LFVILCPPLTMLATALSATAEILTDAAATDN
jgi:hypothetical protein